MEQQQPATCIDNKKNQAQGVQDTTAPGILRALSKYTTHKSLAHTENKVIDKIIKWNINLHSPCNHRQTLHGTHQKRQADIFGAHRTAYLIK